MVSMIGGGGGGEVKTCLYNKATIFLFLGLWISWPEKRVGRSGKKKKKNSKSLNRPYYVKL